MAKLGLGEQEILKRYLDGADTLETALRGLTEADLDLARAEGKWTIREIVHHVVSASSASTTLIQAAILQPGCKYSLDWWDYEAWVEALSRSRRLLGPGIDLARATLRYVSDLVRGMPGAWEGYLLWTRSGSQLTGLWQCLCNHPILVADDVGYGGRSTYAGRTPAVTWS